VNGFFDVTLSAAQLSIDYAGEMVGHSKPDLILLGEADSKGIAPALSWRTLWRRCASPSRPPRASTLPEVGLVILMCVSSKFTNSSTGLKAIRVVFLTSHFRARNQEILEAIDDSIWFLGLH
jgi:hypothetical protein